MLFEHVDTLQMLQEHSVHHKNTKPKTFKGHCMMCSAKDTEGTRNGRIPTTQEEAAALKTKEGLVEYEDGPEPLYLFQHSRP